MPPVHSRTTPLPKGNPLYDPYLAELYPRPAAWVRNAGGNVVRYRGRYRMTVFERPRGSGRYLWVRSAGLGRGSPEYSPATYPTEADAVEAAEAAAG